MIKLISDDLNKVTLTLQISLKSDINKSIIEFLIQENSEENGNK